MVLARKKRIEHVSRCPHCGAGFIAWDQAEKEPFCFICGWRRSIPITPDQARDRFNTEREFWLRLFASEIDPDDAA